MTVEDKYAGLLSYAVHCCVNQFRTQIDWYIENPHEVPSVSEAVKEASKHIKELSELSELFAEVSLRYDKKEV